MVSVARHRVNAGCHVDGGSVRGSPPLPGKDTGIRDPAWTGTVGDPFIRGCGEARADPDPTAWIPATVCFPGTWGFRQPVCHAAAMSPIGSRSRLARKGLDRFPAGELA